MARIDDLLNQLQDEVFGPGFSSQYPPYTDDPEDDYIDVPDAVDTPYKTHFSISPPKGKKRGSNQLSMEQYWLRILEKTEKDETKSSEGDEPENNKERDIDPKDVATTDEPEPEGVEAGVQGMGNTAGVGMGGDMGMGMGMDEPEEEKSPTELGRIYELKKVYSRMTAIESYLGTETSKELLKVRSYVSQAIELFEIISANFNSYKEKLNEIVITYYKFIKEVYDTIRDYYKKESKSGDK